MSCTYNIQLSFKIDYLNTDDNLVNIYEDIILNKYFKMDNVNKKNIKEVINIDYQKYLERLKLFKENYNLPISAYISVEFNIKTEIMVNGKIEYINKSERKVKRILKRFENIIIELNDDETRERLNDN